jgi:hypothetical protein
MKIVVNIEKKYAFAILGALVIIAGLVAIYAFGGSDPATMGHSVGEINWNEAVSGTITAANLSASNGVWSSGWISALGNINTGGSLCIHGDCKDSWAYFAPITCTWTGWFYGDSGAGGVCNRQSLNNRECFDTGTWQYGYFLNLYCDNGRVTQATHQFFYDSN